MQVVYVGVTNLTKPYIFLPEVTKPATPAISKAPSEIIMELFSFSTYKPLPVEYKNSSSRMHVNWLLSYFTLSELFCTTDMHLQERQWLLFLLC